MFTEVFVICTGVRWFRVFRNLTFRPGGDFGAQKAQKAFGRTKLERVFEWKELGFGLWLLPFWSWLVVYVNAYVVVVVGIRTYPFTQLGSGIPFEFEERQNTTLV